MRQGISRQVASQSRAGRADYSVKARRGRADKAVRPKGKQSKLMLFGPKGKQSKHSSAFGPTQSFCSVADMFHFEVVSSDREASESESTGSEINVGFGNPKAKAVPFVIVSEHELDDARESWHDDVRAFLQLVDLVFRLPQDMQEIVFGIESLLGHSLSTSAVRVLEKSSQPHRVQCASQPHSPEATPRYRQQIR